MHSKKIFSLFSILLLIINFNLYATPIYNITSCQQLQNIAQDLRGHYTLMNDIDCSASKGWNDGKGFIPIQNFYGSLDGGNHTIENLYINSSNNSSVGLFANLMVSASVTNLNLTNANVIYNVQGATGLLAGDETDASIKNISVNGAIVGNARGVAGGLIGQTHGGSIENCHFIGKISGQFDIAGGLVGVNSIDNGSLSSGVRQPAIIDKSYASSTITLSGTYGGSAGTGGLVGENYAVIKNSYASGTVTGRSGVGGLVGQNFGGSTNADKSCGTIANAYSIAVVNGSSITAGLIGLSSQGLIVNDYAAGKVNSISGSGLVSYSDKDTFQNDYYDMDTTGKSDTGKGEPKSTAQMQTQSTFLDWDFNNIWSFVPNHYPTLQWQSGPVAPALTIAPISSQVIIGQPTIVSISTSDAFNGNIGLSSTRGVVSPQAVTLTNGHWQGNITFYTSGINTQLIANRIVPLGSGNEVAFSNNFSVLDNTNPLPSNASVEGIVTDTDDNLVAGATIQVFNTRAAVGDPIYSGTTDSTGHYLIQRMLPGNYYMRAVQGTEQVTEQAKIAENRSVTQDFTLTSTCTTIQAKDDKVPVLLLPGIMGSRYDDGPRIYPRLEEDELKWNDKKFIFHNPNGIIGWKKLIKEFKNKGYKLGCTLFKVPYDWAMPVEEASQKYLMPWINYAKQKANSNKVDIVGYSMGGLLARYYIQSPNYANDVRRFAMVGTPNYGSALAYYLWAGGDPIRAGNVVNSFLFKYFYAHTLNELYKIRSTDDASNDGACTEIIVAGISFITACDQTKLHPFIHDEVKEVGQLVPVYSNALLKNGVNQPINIDENSFLKAINNIPCANSAGCKNSYDQSYVFNLTKNILTSDSSGVQSKIFYSTNIDTLKSIIVGNPGAFDLYKDGEPTGKIDTIKAGDQTVTKDSALMDNQFDTPLRSFNKNEGDKHIELIDKFKKDIVKFITSGDLKAADITSPSDDDPTPPMLLIGIEGNAAPSITNGLSDTETISKYNGLNYSAVKVGSPTNAVYSVHIHPYSLHNYTIRLSYLDADNNIATSLQFVDIPSATQDRIFTLQINTGLGSLLKLDRTFQIPQNIKEVNADSSIMLTWDDPTGDTNQDVDHYNIYLQAPNDAYYKYLGQTNSKVYRTFVPWENAADNAFLVQSVLKNGNTTVAAGPIFAMKTS